MKSTTQQWNKIEQLAKKEYIKRNDPFHDFQHALSVSRLAVFIARKEGADVMVCKVAGLLHDIAPKIRGKTHGLESGRCAKNLLEKLKLDNEFIKVVYLAIIYHDGSRSHLAKTLEGKIIYEADKLECYGPVGIIREYGDVLHLTNNHYKAFENLIRYLKEYDRPFFTKTGKKLKKELRNYNKEFVRLIGKYRKV